MDIKHAINDPQSMSHDGGKILQSLQNNHLPLIDIIVREALQNSLDATIKGSKKTKVDFVVDSFKSEELAPYFEEIDSKLIKLYGGHQKFISFSDKNTIGLTGNYTSTEPDILRKSNFHKLVFGIGQHQEQEGAGGSWGYGKTSYFRIGIGLVIYYTRIKSSNGYEERLIASMIEDPASKNRLLSNNPGGRGIAWWGVLQNDKLNSVHPVTDSRTITDILSIFNLKRYSNSETGTTIIIPYVQDRTKNIIDDSVELYPWEKNYEDEILMSIQRWYFPRIMNKEYSEHIGNSVLSVTVNNNYVVPNLSFEPIFNIYQQIYNAALTGKTNDKNIIVKEIRLGQRALKNRNEIVGRIAFKEVSKKELRMLAPHNKENGLKYLGIKNELTIEDFNAKVIAYSRKPGMIVEYSLDNKWCKSNINLKEEHILLGFFVPNSEAKLIDRFEEAGYKNLESYLRDIESSDHATWEDLVDMTLVTRIRNYCSRAITESYQQDEDEANSSVTSGLARKFGNIIMPPKNYGRSSIRREQSTNTKSSKPINRNRNSDLFVMDSTPLNNNNIIANLQIFLRRPSKYSVLVNISSLDKNISETDWYKDFEAKYPFTIKGISIYSINKNKIVKDYREVNLENDGISIEIEKDSVFNIISGTNEELTIGCNIVIETSSVEYIPNIIIRNV